MICYDCFVHNIWMTIVFEIWYCKSFSVITINDIYFTTSSCLTLTISVYSWRPEKFDDLSKELDACLARHAHACTRVMASRTARKIGGSRCRRERSRGGWGEKAEPRCWRRRRGEERGKQERKRAKGGPFVGGYRENEARHRVPHGPFSRHGARRRPQQCGPEEPGPAARARARDRDNDRREPHTRLAHVRAARAVNTNRVFFILGATSLPPSPPPLPLLLLLHPPFPPPLLAAVPAPSVSFSCFRLFFSRLRCYRDGSRSLAVTSHFCLVFFYYGKFTSQGFRDFLLRYIGRYKKVKIFAKRFIHYVTLIIFLFSFFKYYIK